ncbi:MAG: tryptophan synthase subunit alpha [Gammaproteobacteria bacterium]|nr:tryptophan synthase subunit alpha [Gammaproteobacteria bacterium]
MSRLTATLAARFASGTKTLTAFITAGDPSPEATVPALQALVRGGADIVELGVPFSDPEAEGPSIQRSSERALANGVTLASVLDMTREFRNWNDVTPVVLMGYLNSVMRMGYDTFACRARDAGVDGLIVVNLPPEEAAEAQQSLARQDLDLIFLVAPTTSLVRAVQISERASGFIYYVSLKGVTGARHLDTTDVERNVWSLRKVTDLPVQVGFGIRDAESARAVARVADGIVVGSKQVDVMGAPPDEPASNPAAPSARVAVLRKAIDTL